MENRVIGPQMCIRDSSAEDAMIACDFNTLLIVVDVNRPGYVESAALLESINKIDVYKRQEQHCVKAPELLREGGADESIIHAVCSHGWAICVDIKPCLLYTSRCV